MPTEIRKLTKADLDRMAAEANLVTDTAAANVNVSLRAFFRNYINTVKSVLNDVQLSETDQINLAEQANLVNQLREIAVEAGIQDVVSDYEQEFVAIGEDALKYFERFGIERSFGGIDPQLINVLKDGFVRDLELLVDDRLIRPIENAIIHSNIAGRSRRDVVAEVTNVINTEGVLRRDGKEWTDRNIEVFVADSQRRFQQHMRFERAADLDLPIVAYVGPLDRKTRDACRYLLGGSPHGVPGFYYTNEVSAAMHDDLHENPLINNGGFNCRHRFMPMPRRLAEQYGFKSGTQSE